MKQLCEMNMRNSDTALLLCYLCYIVLIAAGAHTGTAAAREATF
jgi:hypothetical protein